MLLFSYNFFFREYNIITVVQQYYVLHNKRLIVLCGWYDSGISVKKIADVSKLPVYVKKRTLHEKKLGQVEKKRLKKKSCHVFQFQNCCLCFKNFLMKGEMRILYQSAMWMASSLSGGFSTFIYSYNRRTTHLDGSNEPHFWLICNCRATDTCPKWNFA